MKWIARALGALALVLCSSVATFSGVIPSTCAGADCKVLSTTYGPAPTMTTEYVLWGDSLEHGVAPVFASLVSPATVVDNGVPGQSTLQIGVRAGAISATITSTTNQICNPGGDVVTPLVGYEPLTGNGPAGGVTGSLAGQHGTLTLSGATYTFTCDVVSTTYALLNATPFVIDQNYRQATTQIFWFGHNNGNVPQGALWNVAQSIAANTVPSSQYGLVSDTYDTGNVNVLPTGIFGVTVTQNNNFKLNTFGASHYIDINTPMIAAYNSSYPPDATDHGNGIAPTSERLISGVGTLTGTINNAVTSITVNITSGITANNDVLIIENGSNAEGVVIVSGATGTTGSQTLTVTRAWNGSAVSHNNGVTVYDTNTIHYGAKSNGDAVNGCIAAGSAYHSNFPSASQNCGYDIAASTYQSWAVANPPPTPVAPTQNYTATGQMTVSAGLEASSSNPNQAPLGTTKHPVQVTASEVNIPGYGYMGPGGSILGNVTIGNLTIGSPTGFVKSWFSCSIVGGNDTCAPLNAQNVTLGTSSSTFRAGDIANVAFFNQVINPDTGSQGGVGTSAKPFATGFFSGGLQVGSGLTNEGAGSINFLTMYVNNVLYGFEGNATKIQTFTGAGPVAGNFATWDASGNLKDSGVTCTTSCTVSAVAGGSDTQVQYNNATSLAGISGVTSNGATMSFAAGSALFAANGAVLANGTTCASPALTFGSNLTTGMSNTGTTIQFCSNNTNTLTISSSAGGSISGAGSSAPGMAIASGAGVKVWPDHGVQQAGMGYDVAGDNSLYANNGGTAVEWIRLTGTNINLPQAGFATCTGLTTSSGNLLCTVSDRRVKNITSGYSDGLSFVRDVAPQLYTFKKGTKWYDGERVHLGLIAQDVQRTLPRAVVKMGDGHLTIDYNAVTAAELSAIKELDQEIEWLKTLIEVLGMSIAVLSLFTWRIANDNKQRKAA